MYRILVCGLTSNLGGIEKVILNFYQFMNKEKYALDFICLGNEKIGFHQEFEKNSNYEINYYYLPKPSDNPFFFRKKLNTFFKETASKYDAIWVNLCQLSNIEYLKMAKKYNIPKRIIHSHNGDDDCKGIKRKLHMINRHFIQWYATDFWACSDEASKWFYPSTLQNEVKLIHNAINVETFLFDKSKRDNLRKKLGIHTDEIVIGHIGRISFQKNQEFLISVFANLYSNMKDIKLILIGGGDDSKLRDLVKEKGIEDRVLFLGLQTNAENFYSVFDFFFFPSNYEGLPVTLLEAQANGLPILASEVISKQSIINENLYFYSLDNPVESWTNELEKLIKSSKRVNQENIIDNFTKEGFEIKLEAKRIEKFFEDESKA